MKRSIVTLCVSGLIGVVACSSDPGADPGGGTTGGGSDASTHDASKGHTDASSTGPGNDASNGIDSSLPGDDDSGIGGGQDDSGSDDSGPITTDSGAHDSGSHDSGAHDSGAQDAGTQDAGHDSGVVDSGAHDSGVHDTGVVDTGSDAAIALQQLCVNEVNRYRATNGKPALARWTAEETCADGQSKSDSASGTAHGAFGQCNEFGQCECPGWGGPLETMIIGCLKAMWDEGPGGGHYDIMNSDSYTKVACGFYTMTSGKIWAVQDYK